MAKLNSFHPGRMLGSAEYGVKFNSGLTRGKSWLRTIDREYFHIWFTEHLGKQQ